MKFEDIKNIDQILEKTAEVVVGLLVGLLLTSYHFVLHPSKFADLGNLEYLPPLTFLITSIITFSITLLILAKVSDGKNFQVVMSPSPKKWEEALLKFDLKGLVAFTIPFLGIILIHSGIVYGLYRLFGFDIDFKPILSASSYTFGLFFVLCTLVGMIFLVTLPLSLSFFANHRTNMPPWWVWIIGALFWLVMLKACHSYLTLLSIYSNGSIFKSLGIWMLSIVLFLILFFLIALWYWPVLFPDEQKLGFGPKASILSKDHAQKQIEPEE